MNTKHIAWMLFLLAVRIAFGQGAGTPRMITPVVAAVPTITILAAPTGAWVQSQGAGDATINLGPISYFKGTSALGEASQKKAARS